MHLKLLRLTLTDKSTEGELYINDALAAVTLELPVKDGLHGSAIAPGTYQVTIAQSPHFGMPMPLLVGVPNRSAIEIHWGNSPHDTEGCILVGKKADADFIEASRETFNNLYGLIKTAVEGEGCEIEIVGGIPQLPLVQDPELGL